MSACPHNQCPHWVDEWPYNIPGSPGCALSCCRVPPVRRQSASCIAIFGERTDPLESTVYCLVDRVKGLESIIEDPPGLDSIAMRKLCSDVDAKLRLADERLDALEQIAARPPLSGVEK